MASELVDEVHRGRVEIVDDGEDHGVVRIGGRDHPRLATIEHAARIVLRLRRQGRTVTVVSRDPRMREFMGLVGVSAWPEKNSSRPMNVEPSHRLPYVPRSQEEATMTTITTISTVAIPTRNQDSSKAFYIDKLGFEERVDVEMSVGFRWIEADGPTGQPNRFHSTPKECSS